MKKKKTAKEPPILTDDLGIHDKRDAYRYIFPESQRLAMSFKGKTVALLDISAGGLAFENQGFSQYDADRITLSLDMPNFTGDPRFTAWTRILHITANNVCHCIFEDCRVDEYEVVHKFVLEMQKRDLNASRNNS
ncbi:MAG: PilZ domain-containing protein [Desulfobacter sp.]|nr:MAG: PilZ domain-containing protein [Desulfobacter sp.]